MTAPLTETVKLHALDSVAATYKRVDLAAHEQLFVHLDVDRFRALGRPGEITVTIEVTT